MKHIFMRGAVALVGLGALLTCGLVAQASPWHEDQVSSHDRQEYGQDNFSQRFGVKFHSHASVCDQDVDGVAHCDARVVTDDNGDPLTIPGVTKAALPAGYGPAQFLKAYNLTGTYAGTKRPVIAIVDAYDDPNIQSDLNQYSATYGIPALPACTGAIAGSNKPCFQKVSETGTTHYPTANAGWSLEIALDVETAHATCQNCGVLLVEANSASFVDLGKAENEAVALGATAVSNSYGGSEFSQETSTAYDGYFNHPGVAITVSSGDGAYGVEYPAASKYVTAVGGTSLFLNPDGTYASEAAWAGAGSGCSAYESKPSWQTDITGCARRTVADVSADADPNTGAAVYDTVRYSGHTGWFQVGGTSLASPLIAAVYALSGNIPTGKVESALPYANPAALNDVTTGTNGTCGTYLCTGKVGYDGPTGLGSPKGAGAF